MITVSLRSESKLQFKNPLYFSAGFDTKITIGGSRRCCWAGWGGKATCLLIRGRGERLLQNNISNIIFLASLGTMVSLARRRNPPVQLTSVLWINNFFVSVENEIRQQSDRSVDRRQLRYK